MPEATRGRASLARRAGAVLAYLAAARLLLAPVLASPVVADDFANPWVQTDAAGTGLGEALRYGWDGATKGASFRIVGNLVGSGFNWWWPNLSARLDVSMSTIYAGVKFVVFLGVAAAAAWVWAVASRLWGRGVRFVDALVAVSLALFGTVQLHALWSNDPVGNYPLSGFGGAGAGLVAIGAGLVAIERRTPAAFVGATAATVGAVLYYEANIGAVLAVGLLLAVAVVRSEPGRRARLALGGLAMTAAPAVLVLYGRTLTGGQTDTYSGTTTRLSGAPRAFALGIAGSVPGAAWRLSRQVLGGIDVVLVGLAIVAVVAVTTWWWWSSARPFTVQRTPSDADADAEARPSDRIGLATLVVALVGFASFAVALQAITVKVQDEARQLGFVYTAYAFASTVAALGLAVVVVRVFRGRAPVAARSALAIALVAFLAVQSCINWRLAERTSQAFAVNRVLLSAWDDDASSADRCSALVAWRQVPWPAYYEDGVTFGLQDAYLANFGEPFCPGAGEGGAADGG